MCEILVYDPSEYSTDNAFDVSLDMFQSNSDGLGALAVYKNDGQFEYEAFAQAVPSWTEYLDFLMESEDAWRVILHARLSTTGADNNTNTHPLPVGDGPDIDWVVHNGVVTNHDEIKDAATSAGHTYATEVDSESIAHMVDELPDEVSDIDTDEEYRLQGRLNYILCNEDGIFVHNTGKYEWAEDFTVTTCSRDTSFDNANRSIKWMVVKPDEVKTVEVAGRRRASGYGYSGNWNRGRNRSRSRGSTQRKFQSGSSSGRSTGTSDVSKHIGETDLPDDIDALFDDDGELIAWWDEEDENRKHVTDYDRYKQEYGSDSGNEVRVKGEELGEVLSPDDRVPDKADGMYVTEEGDRIEWWNIGKDSGNVEIDEVVFKAELEAAPTEDWMMDMAAGMQEDPIEEEVVIDGDDSGNSNQKSTGKGSRSSASTKKSSGGESKNVNGVTYSEEELELWSGHYG